MVEKSGIEPPTSRLSGERSDQLSYFSILEEGVGFEPTGDAHTPPTVFRTAAISQTLPTLHMAESGRVERPPLTGASH